MANLNMRRAFNSKMLTKLVRFSIEEGSFDEHNNWVKGATTQSNIWAVMISGNKFSQFEIGQAIQSEDGGIRISDYKSIHITDRFNLELGDKLLYKGDYFNVLQRSDEAEYNYRAFLIEKSEGWKP